VKLPRATAAEKERFYDIVVEQLQKVAFGTFTKKDLECLLLHAFLEASVLKTRRNRDLTNILEINETKLKSTLLEIRYKYLPDAKRQNIEKLIQEVFLAVPSRLVHENGHFVFAVEDPVVKIDFEQAMKEVGYYSDSSFNKEIVKVRDYALVAFLFRMNNNDHTFSDLQRMREVARTNEQDLLSKITLTKTWLEVGRDILEATKSGYEKVEVLVKLSKFFATGAFS
jgi:hypothetical protein